VLGRILDVVCLDYGILGNYEEFATTLHFVRRVTLRKIALPLRERSRRELWAMRRIFALRSSHGQLDN
jgi:hypothetical protein